MLRQSLSGNSSEASSLFAPSNRTVYFHRRTVTGGTTSTTSSAATAAPYWVKVVRRSNTMSAYTSPDGATWRQVGSNVSISMTNPVYVGLAVTSGSTNATATATFDNVSLSTP